MPLVSVPAASRTDWVWQCPSGCVKPVSSAGQSLSLWQENSPWRGPSTLEVVGSCSCPLSRFLPSERSQDSTAVALSDSSSTQDFFNEPPSSLEGSRKPYAEKRLPMPSSQPGPSGKDLPGATEERGMKT